MTQVVFNFGPPLVFAGVPVAATTLVTHKLTFSGFSTLRVFAMSGRNLFLAITIAVIGIVPVVINAV